MRRSSESTLPTLSATRSRSICRMVFRAVIPFCWFVAILALIPSVGAQTQTTGSLSGRVYDASTPTKEGVADVRMVLVDQETGVRRALLTGDNGEYSFDLLLPSWYELSCQPEGYENLSGTQRNVQVFIATRRELKLPPFELRKIPPGRARPSPSAALSSPAHWLQPSAFQRESSFKTSAELFESPASIRASAFAMPLGTRVATQLDWPSRSSQFDSMPAMLDFPVVPQARTGSRRFLFTKGESRNVLRTGRMVGGLRLLAPASRLPASDRLLLTASALTAYQADPPFGEPDQLAGGQTSQTPPTTPSSPPISSGRREARSLKLVDTLSATRGGTFAELDLLSLPLQGIRTFDALALLLPGVVQPPQTISATTGPGIGAGLGTAGQFSANGLRSRGNNFTIDGSDNNDEDVGVRRQGFTSLVPQSIESVKQFQIATLLAEPQYGRNLGAQANVVSRSGTSRYHGMLYGFFTDQRLNARNYFDQTVGSIDRFPVPRSSTDATQVFLDAQPMFEPNPVGSENPLTRSQAGFVMGGPLRPQRSHVFASFEHQDLNASRESHFAVPTVSQRGLLESGARGLETRLRIGNREFRRIYFPTTGFGDAIFSLFPWPNNPLGPYGYNTRTEILPADADGSIFSFKVDHRFEAFGRQQTLSGRYNFSEDASTLPVTGEALYSSIRPRVRTQNLSLILDTLLSNQSSSQMRFSYGRTRLSLDEFPNGLRGEAALSFQDPLDRQFLLNAPLVYNFTAPLGSNPTTAYRSYESLRLIGAAGLPPVNGSEALTKPIGQLVMTGFSPLGVDVFNLPQQRTNNTFQYAATLIHNFPKLHRLTAGVDIRRSQLNSWLDRNSRSQLVFSGAPNLNQQDGKPNEVFGQGQVLSGPTRPSLFYRGADFAAVAAATGFFQALNGPEAFTTIGLRYWQSDFFVADQIRVRPNLSLTLGLRYSLNTVPREQYGRIEASFDSPVTQAFIAAEKQASQSIGKPPVSGLELFLDGRDAIFRRDNNNLAPYLAFAWDPGNQGRTSVRGGFGIYYDQIPGAIISQSRNVFPAFLTLNFGGYQRQPGNSVQELSSTNPQTFARPGTLNVYDDRAGGTDLVAFMIGTSERTNNGSGPAFVLPSADLKTASAAHWSLGLEEELWQNSVFSLAYVGTCSRHLLRFATPNLGPNVIPVVLQIDSRPGSIEPFFRGTTVAPGTLVLEESSRLTTNGRPFPFLGSYTSVESDADSSYHSLQLELNRRFSRGFQSTAAYTWGHAIDEVSDLFDLAGSRAFPQNSFDRRAERGNAGFDVRHRLAGSFIWDLPLFQRSQLYGGWQLAGVFTLQTGQPFTILAPFDLNLDGNLTDRLNTRVGFREVNDGPLRFEFADPLNQLASLGNAGAEGRNTFRAPGIATLDLAVTKHFRFQETRDLELRAEFFNVFHRTHFGMPVHQVDFPGFGSSVNTLIPGRVIQLGLRLTL
jgi:hypothetical protein